MTPDFGNVFERLRIAMEIFCCYPDNLRQRLRAVDGQINILLDEDFSGRYASGVSQTGKSRTPAGSAETPRFRDTRRAEIAKLFLVVYTKAARLG